MRDKTVFRQIDISERRTLCERAGIQNPSDATLWRIKDAYQIVAANGVRLSKIDKDGTRHFEIASQSKPGESYHVFFNGSPASYCDCPDWHWQDKKDADRGCPFNHSQCKHSLSGRLAWNLNRYRLDENSDRPQNCLSQRELRHRLDRCYGAGRWKALMIGVRKARIWRLNGKGVWCRTINKAERTANWYVLRDR